MKKGAWFAVMLLSGCASTDWIQEGKTHRDFTKDSYTCAKETAKHDAILVQGMLELVKFMIPSVKVDGDMYRGCMAASGWTQLRKD